MSAWRARAFYLTRNRAFLAKVVMVILTSSALTAALLLAFGDADPSHPSQTKGSGGVSVPRGEQVREDYKRLLSLQQRAPAQLASWLRETSSRWKSRPADPTLEFDALALRLGELELHPVLARHTDGQAQQLVFQAYTRCRFLPDGEALQTAWHELDRTVVAAAPPRFAHEFRGDVLMSQGRPDEALKDFMCEGRHDDATYSRKLALKTALALRDMEALGSLCADPRVLDEAPPLSLWLAAKILGDKKLLFRALWTLQWRQWMQGAAVPVALLAAGIWYLILVYTGSRERSRWWRYLSAVFAGVVSVWLLHWWQGTLQYRSSPEEQETMTHEIFHWIMYVGVPEEAAKLCLFAFFLPVLLHHRSDGKAALTAGCVGLGFALDENLHYFFNYGSRVAIGRLLTANFMHVSLTGLLGWHLYELFRSRFHHATEFLAVFAGAAAAHGLYDFSTGAAASEWGVDVFGVIILALSSRLYFQRLQLEGGQPLGMTISRTAVFCIGTALLVGLLMIVLSWQLRSLKGITEALKGALGVAMVALVYVREFREV